MEGIEKHRGTKIQLPLTCHIIEKLKKFKEEQNYQRDIQQIAHDVNLSHNLKEIKIQMTVMYLRKRVIIL